MIAASKKYVSFARPSSASGLTRREPHGKRSCLSEVTKLGGARQAATQMQSSSRYMHGLVREAMSSTIPAITSALLIAVRKLHEFESLEPNWNGRGADAPSMSALAHARRALESLHFAGLEPERVTAMPEGGVAIYCFGVETIEGGARARYARLAFPNDDVPYVTLTDRVAGTSRMQSAADEGATPLRLADIVATFLGS